MTNAKAPPAVKLAAWNMIAEQNTTARWYQDCCLVLTGNWYQQWARSSDMHQWYVAWCKRPLVPDGLIDTPRAFGLKMHKLARQYDRHDGSCYAVRVRSDSLGGLRG